jgi:hypothetical protein
MTETVTRAEIRVTVTFPITKKGPFEEQVARGATVGSVRTAAMDHFGAQDDSQFVYVLAYNGVEEGNDRTVGQVAGTAQAAKFTLVKKIAQG